MSDKYKEYISKEDLLYQEYNEKSEPFREKGDELVEKIKKTTNEYDDLKDEYGVFVSIEDGNLVLESKKDAVISPEIGEKLLNLYKQNQELKQLYDKAKEQVLFFFAELQIKRIQLKKEAQFSAEDYFNHRIDSYYFYEVEKEEQFVMANLLNNFEHVEKINDEHAYGMSSHAAVVTRYKIDKDHLETTCGIMDLLTGEEILPLVFNTQKIAVNTYANLRCPRSAKAWGIEPNTHLESIYDKVVYSNVAIVSKDGKFGICDMYSGDTIIPCEHKLDELPKMWEELDNRETSPSKDLPYNEIKNKLLQEYVDVRRLGQVYFVTNDTRYIGGIMGPQMRGPYAIYSAISGDIIIPSSLDLNFHGIKEVYKNLGCPIEPVNQEELDQALGKVEAKTRI